VATTASAPTANISTANISTANISTGNISSIITNNVVATTASVPTANISTANISTANISTGNISSIITNSISFNTFSSFFYNSFQTTTTNDGIAYSTATSSAAFFNGLQPFTYECFFNPSATPASGGTIFYIGSNSSNTFQTDGYEIHLNQRVGTGGLGFYFPSTSANPQANRRTLSTSVAGTLPLNTWTHLALVGSFSTGNLSLYSNGVFATSTTFLRGGGTVYLTNGSLNPLILLFSNPLGQASGQGYINSFRATNRILYTGDFTPPPIQLTSTTVGTTGANVASSLGTYTLLHAVESSFSGYITSGTPVIASSSFSSIIYASSIFGIANSNIGINCNSPLYTLDVNGTINAKTGVYSNGTLLTSDRRIKEFIEDADLNICYSNVKALPLRRYQYISSFATTKNDCAQIGFIADELSSIFPKSVFEFDNHVDPNFSSLLYINSDQIFMSHYGATQQLMSVVEQQSTQIATLLEQNSTLTHLCGYIPQLMNAVSTLQG
jgi:hypothetical protein